MPRKLHEKESKSFQELIFSNGTNRHHIEDTKKRRKGRKEGGPKFIPDTKTNLECIIGLNAKRKTTKFLGESTGENLCDLGLGMYFLGYKKHET